MEQKKQLPQRKPVRHKSFDYNTSGAYFITICTEKRRRILSNIVGGDVLDAPKSIELLPCGEIAKKYIDQLNDFYADIEVAQYVIMPNHIHIMLHVSGCETEQMEHMADVGVRQHSAVSRFVSTFKRFFNKEYGKNIWQRHFYDHIIRDTRDYEEHIEYIYGNPARWYYDELYEE